MAAINLSGYIEDGKVETVILAPTFLSSATAIISRRLADTGTGGGDSGDSGDSAVSKESWS
jgi:hypothetical protein